jgi:HK97 family phage major capsid protein
MTDTDITTSVETALAAFSEYKGLVEGFKTKLGSFEGKMDAFDATKFDRIQTDIGNAIEQSQKTAAATEALNIKLAEQEKTNDKLLAVLARPGIHSGNVEERSAELKQKRNKLFNDYARVKDGTHQLNFESYVKQNVTDELEMKALAVNSDPNGGYLTTPEFGGIVKTFIYESSPIRPLASTIDIGTDTFELIIDDGQASCGWVGETQTRSETNTPVLGKLQITANELYAQPKISQKMLDDSIIDIEAWLAQKVAELFGRTEETAFVAGNGVNQPMGILSYANGTDVTQKQIQQVPTISGTSFTYLGLVNLQASLKEQYQANATFLLQRASIANIMTIVDGMGRPIFNLTFDKNTGLESGILGRPLRFANDVPAVATNALAMIYGDIRKSYQIVDRIGMRILRDPFTTKGYVLFYTTKRTGGSVVNFEALKIGRVSVS